MSCFIDSLDHRMLKSLAHASIETNKATKMTKPQILAIQEAICDEKIKSRIAAIATITKIDKLKYQILMYHDINSFSLSENTGFDKFFFMNGAKNIIPAIAESFA